MNAWMLELVGGPLRAMRRATFWWSIGLTALVLIPVFALPGGAKRSARSEQKAGTAA